MIDKYREEDPKTPSTKYVCASLLKYKPWLCNSRVKIVKESVRIM